MWGEKMLYGRKFTATNGFPPSGSPSSSLAHSIVTEREIKPVAGSDAHRAIGSAAAGRTDLVVLACRALMPWRKAAAAAMMIEPVCRQGLARQRLRHGWPRMSAAEAKQFLKQRLRLRLRRKGNRHRQ